MRNSVCSDQKDVDAKPEYPNLKTYQDVELVAFVFNGTIHDLWHCLPTPGENLLTLGVEPWRHKIQNGMLNGRRF
jgi:hypothetical protein